MSHFSTPIGSECAEFWLMNYPNYIIEILIRSCRQLVREIIIGNVSCHMQHTLCRSPLRFDTLTSDLTWREKFSSSSRNTINVKCVHPELQLGNINDFWELFRKKSTNYKNTVNSAKTKSTLSSHGKLPRVIFMPEFFIPRTLLKCQIQL